MFITDKQITEWQEQIQEEITTQKTKDLLKRYPFHIELCYDDMNDTAILASIKGIALVGDVGRYVISTNGLTEKEVYNKLKALMLKLIYKLKITLILTIIEK